MADQIPERVISPELEAKVRASADRHEIRGAELDAVLEWVEGASLASTLLDMIEKGWMEIAEVRDGEPAFKVTEAGSTYIKAKHFPH